MLEYPSLFNILDFLGITCWYWPLEYSRIFMKSQLNPFTEFTIRIVVVTLEFFRNFMNFQGCLNFYKGLGKT